MMNMRWPKDIGGVSVPYGRRASELQALVAGGSTERWVAIVALAESSDPMASGYLAGLAASRDEHVRRFVVQWIGRIPRRRELDEVVVEHLLDASGVVARTAAQVAADLGISEAHDRLIEMTRATSCATRAEAVRALEKLWHEEDFESVVAIFQGDVAPEVRRMAAWTLWATRTAAHASRLFDLWRGDLSGRHRAWACQMAAEFPSPEFHEPCASLQDDPDGHVRKAARRAVEAIEEV